MFLYQLGHIQFVCRTCSNVAISTWIHISRMKNLQGCCFLNAHMQFVGKNLDTHRNIATLRNGEFSIRKLSQVCF